MNWVKRTSPRFSKTIVNFGCRKDHWLKRCSVYFLNRYTCLHFLSWCSIHFFDRTSVHCLNVSEIHRCCCVGLNGCLWNPGCRCLWNPFCELPRLESFAHLRQPIIVLIIHYSKNLAIWQRDWYKKENCGGWFSNGSDFKLKSGQFKMVASLDHIILYQHYFCMGYASQTFFFQFVFSSFTTAGL